MSDPNLVSPTVVSLPQPPDDEPLSWDVTTTTAGTDLIESIAVLSFGAGIALLFALSWFGLVLLAAPLFLWWAYRRRMHRGVQNEHDLRCLQYQYSPAQIKSITAAFPPGAMTAFEVLTPDEAVSRWQVERLLKMHMGEAPAVQNLSLVLGYAQRLQIKQQPSS
jgi:hypothetical protein